MKRITAYILVAIFFFMIAAWGALNSAGYNANAEESDNWTASSNVSIHFDSPFDFGESFKNALLIYSANWVKSLSDNLTLIVDDAIEDVFQRQNALLDEKINTIVIFLFFILITALAAWKQNPFLDVMAAIVNTICGFKFTGDQDPGSIGWLVGFMIIMIGAWFIFNRIYLEIKRFMQRQVAKEKDEE